MLKRATEYGNSLYEIGLYKNAPNIDKVIAAGEVTISDDVAAKAKDTLQPMVLPEKVSPLEFLNTISGQYTIAGIHNREPNSNPTLQTDQMNRVTGLTPGLWSGDFLFSALEVSNRWTMIKECVNQYQQGAIVNLMMHVTAPNLSEDGPWDGGVITKLTNDQWTSLITDGGDLNIAWKKRLDGLAVYFQYLKDNGVTAMFRPFHEMNQSAFWWGGRPGENCTAALYRLTKDYLVNEKNIDNLIWVWDMQDLDYNWKTYNPGDDYWDVFAVDFYNGDGYVKRKYDLALQIAGDKPIAIGECDTLPTAAELVNQPRWTFFMSWAELTFQKNSNAKLQALYSAPNVLVREEMPGWK